MKSSFLIAAPTSGSGKTTIARGLMALLTAKGYQVQPFKCGPDYIDTKFHEAVCGRPSVNLDTFMATPEHVCELFSHYGKEEIAQVLGIPVVLVVDAKSAAYSTAALLSGFVHFREGVHVAGVIFNRVGSEKHFAILQQVCDDLNIPCLGYLPKSTVLEQGSRYLGLDFSHLKVGVWHAFSQLPETKQLVELIEHHVRWKQLLSE